MKATDLAKGPYCSHNRLEGSCEDCAFEAAKKEGRVSGELRPVVTTTEPKRAEKDTLVPDKQVKGQFTQVKAGDPLPG